VLVRSLRRIGCAKKGCAAAMVVAGSGVAGWSAGQQIVNEEAIRLRFQECGLAKAGLMSS
jgi:hypothetical protein